MAPAVDRKQQSSVENNSFEQDKSAENMKLPCDCEYEPSGRSHKYEDPVELVELQNDLAELLNLIHVVERTTVKEVIQADIDLVLAKLESINDLRSQQEPKLSWSKLAT